MAPLFPTCPANPLGSPIAGGPRLILTSPRRVLQTVKRPS